MVSYLDSSSDDKGKVLYQDLKSMESRGFNVLQGVPVESIWGLLESCTVDTLDPGKPLLSKGDANHTMYMVLEGELGVYLEDTDKEPIACLKAGQTVGEISVIDGSPASARVIAIGPTRLLAIDEETFWRLIKASHEFACNLLALLAARMRTNNFTISENVKLRQQFERAAAVDGLTGLYNRRWLDDKLSRLAARHHRSKKPLSIIMLDIDHFKGVNDNFGHFAGDRVLEAVADALTSNLRPTDLAARYGGEEFVAILPDTMLSGARVAAERLRRAVADIPARSVDDTEIPSVTISLGVAQLEDDEHATDALIRADAALYRAKEKGRNRVEW